MATDSASIIHNALGSAAAGIVGRIFTHPLDTCKARLQAVGAKYNGPFEVLSRTLRTEGARGLYRGFGTVIIAGTPGTMLYLCSYDVLKSRFESGNSSDFLVHFGCGMVAETIACVIYVPVDVVKERLQVQHLNGVGNYRNGWDAFRQISRTEGLQGIYRGYGATLASFGPFSALYFVFYERLKSWSRQSLHLPSSTDLPFGYVVLSSCTAGAMASWLTSPLDMAKLRLQIQRGRLATTTSTTTAVTETASLTYKGLLDCLETTYRVEGVRGLFRGAGARVLHFAPATTITMTCYETFRSFFARNLPIQ